jgi:hypothetical protein
MSEQDCEHYSSIKPISISLSWRYSCSVVLSFSPLAWLDNGCCESTTHFLLNLISLPLSLLLMSEISRQSHRHLERRWLCCIVSCSILSLSSSAFNLLAHWCWFFSSNHRPSPCELYPDMWEGNHDEWYALLWFPSESLLPFHLLILFFPSTQHNQWKEEWYLLSLVQYSSISSSCRGSVVLACCSRSCFLVSVLCVNTEKKRKTCSVKWIHWSIVIIWLIIQVIATLLHLSLCVIFLQKDFHLLKHNYRLIICLCLSFSIMPCFFLVILFLSNREFDDDFESVSLFEVNKKWSSSSFGRTICLWYMSTLNWLQESRIKERKKQTTQECSSLFILTLLVREESRGMTLGQ